MADKSSLKFARTETGYRFVVEGKGTMSQSRPAETFIVEALRSADVSVVVDLAGCIYLDSTFLGCLLGLHHLHGPSRFRVAAPTEITRKLFGPTRLDLVMKVTQDFPKPVGDYVTLRQEAVHPRDMARHIMECHQQLARIPGPQQHAFAAIAQQMETELETRA